MTLGEKQQLHTTTTNSSCFERIFISPTVSFRLPQGRLTYVVLTSLTGTYSNSTVYSNEYSIHRRSFLHATRTYVVEGCVLLPKTKKKQLFFLLFLYIYRPVYIYKSIITSSTCITNSYSRCESVTSTYLVQQLFLVYHSRVVAVWCYTGEVQEFSCLARRWGGR